LLLGAIGPYLGRDERGLQRLALVIHPGIVKPA
jgi:hypothetical protein